VSGNPNIIWIIVWSCLASALQAQTDSLLLAPWLQMSCEKANQIELDEEDNFYLLNTRRNKIHKYYAATGYDSLQSIGGKGIGGEGFNQPVKIRIINRQALYCLDYGNRRLVVMNTNLKVLRDINFLSSGQSETGNDSGSQIWPVSFESGPTGDLFILNQEDNKILKIDMYGKPQLSFGGLDYGQGSLYEPLEMEMNDRNLLFVSDTGRQQLKIFDLFGVYQYALYPPEQFRFKGFCLMDKMLVLYDEKTLCLLNLTSSQYAFFRPDLKGDRVIDVAMNRKLLVILTGEHLFGFRLPGEKP
jgi:hypothetical protein